MPRALVDAGAVGLVERGLVDEADAEPRRDLLQRRRHLERVRAAFQLARPGDQRQRQRVAEARRRRPRRWRWESDQRSWLVSRHRPDHGGSGDCGVNARIRSNTRVAPQSRPAAARRRCGPCVRWQPDAPSRNSRSASVEVAHRKAQRRQPRAIADASAASTPKWSRNADRRHHLRCRRAASARAMPAEVVSNSRWPVKAERKIVMVARVFGDQHDARDAVRAVGMALECRVPEILRMVLLAGEEADVGRCADRARRPARTRP